MAKKNANTPKNDNIETIEMLKAKLAELERLQAVSVEKNTHSKQEEKLQLDEYIEVMSLLPYPLVLSTLGLGKGTLKEFKTFGEIKKILYKDLVEIIDSNRAFMESGFFYILDKRVIKSHGLDEIYDKILTKDKMEEILTSNPESGLSLFKTANPEQQKIIIGMLVEKVVSEPKSVDMNLVDLISREYDIDIRDKIEMVSQIREQVDTKP